MGVILQKFEPIRVSRAQSNYYSRVRSILQVYQSKMNQIISRIEERILSSAELQALIKEYLKHLKTILSIQNLFSQPLSIPPVQNILNIHIPLVQDQQFPELNSDQINQLLLETDLNQVQENLNFRANQIYERINTEDGHVLDFLSNRLSLINKAFILEKLYCDEIQQFLENLSLQTEEFINSQIIELQKTKEESQSAFLDCFIKMFSIHIKSQIYHLFTLVNYQLTNFNTFLHYSRSSFSELQYCLTIQFHAFQLRQRYLFKETLRQNLELNSNTITEIDCLDDISF